MQFAIVHVITQLPIAKFDAVDIADAARQYVEQRPELECDSVLEFASKYPVLYASLSVVSLQ